MEQDDAGAAKKAAIWDCGSSLYDSFELEALKRQLSSTIAARSYSMPHLSDPAPAPQRPPGKPSKISRSLHGLLRAVFRVGAGAATPAASPPPPPLPGCVHMGRGHCGVRLHGGGDGGVAEASGKKAAVAATEQLGPAVRKKASKKRFRGTVPVVSRISCH